MNRFYIMLQRQLLGQEDFGGGFLAARIFWDNLSNASLQLKLVFAEVSIYSALHESAIFLHLQKLLFFHFLNHAYYQLI